LRCADLIAPASIGKLPDSSCYDLGDPVVVSTRERLPDAPVVIPSVMG